MRIVLIRHGEVPGNRERRYIGRTDESLSDNGRLQARALSLPSVDRIYSSPYLRCLQTAQLLFPGREPIVSGDLRECDFGMFEGKTADELADCPEYRAWVEGGCIGQIPDGESISAFQQRCCAAFEAIVRNEAGRSDALAFVVHGGVIMAVLAQFDRQKRDYFVYHIGNCAAVSCDCEIGDELLLSVLGGALC
jgi:alpha-ribazole phosphatase